MHNSYIHENLGEDPDELNTGISEAESYAHQICM